MLLLYPWKKGWNRDIKVTSLFYLFYITVEYIYTYIPRLKHEKFVSKNYKISQGLVPGLSAIRRRGSTWAPPPPPTQPCPWSVPGLSVWRRGSSLASAPPPPRGSAPPLPAQPARQKLSNKQGIFTTVLYTVHCTVGWSDLALYGNIGVNQVYF